MVDEDWDVLVSFLPQGWRELARDTGALKGLRKDKTVDNLLRTLLLHLGCGHSLRETVVRARQAHLADLSDVALLKRLKKSKGWLHALCVRLFEEQGLAVVPGGAYQIRAVDATTVKEPGPSGSLWRLHYSVGLPSLTCDFFKLTGTEGPGTGESLAQFPIRAGDPFPPRTCWSGIACDGRSNWCSSASSRWPSWGMCRSTTTRAPRLGSTGNCSWHCWWRN